MRGAVDLYDGFVSADGVVAVLKVEAEGEVSGVLEEDFADGAYTSVRAVSVADGVDMDKYRPGGRYSPPQERRDRCNGRGRRGRSW